MDSSEMTALAQVVGDELEYWRKRRGLTREALAELAGVSTNTVGRYERGNTSPDVPTTWALAKALDIKLSALIARAEDAAKIDAPESNKPVTFEDD